MTREQRELAELVYWDALSRGGIWRKTGLSVVNLLCFGLLIALPVSTTVKAFGLTLTGLFVIPACLCLIRAARTVRNVCAVQDCAAALAALRSAPTPKLRKERIYTPDYAFFFQQSAVVDVRNTDYFYLEWLYSLRTAGSTLDKRSRDYRVGAARKSGGYQILLKKSHLSAMWRSSQYHFSRPPELFQTVVKELKQFYPEIPVDDSGMRH